MREKNNEYANQISRRKRTKEITDAIQLGFVLILLQMITELD